MTGWGYTNTTKPGHATLLQEIKIPLQPDDFCIDSYEGKISPDQIDTMFCAGDGQMDSCQVGLICRIQYLIESRATQVDR